MADTMGKGRESKLKGDFSFSSGGEGGGGGGGAGLI